MKRQDNTIASGKGENENAKEREKGQDTHTHHIITKPHLHSLGSIHKRSFAHPAAATPASSSTHRPGPTHAPRTGLTSSARPSEEPRLGELQIGRSTRGEGLFNRLAPRDESGSTWTPGARLRTRSIKQSSLFILFVSVCCSLPHNLHTPCHPGRVAASRAGPRSKIGPKKKSGETTRTVGPRTRTLTLAPPQRNHSAILYSSNRQSNWAGSGQNKTTLPTIQPFPPRFPSARPRPKKKTYVTAVFTHARSRPAGAATA